jgi:hypothetical protein
MASSTKSKIDEGVMDFILLAGVIAGMALAASALARARRNARISRRTDAAARELGGDQ